MLSSVFYFAFWKKFYIRLDPLWHALTNVAYGYESINLENIFQFFFFFIIYNEEGV